jgi:drug/metabolite transporter (DMT)-like permease
MVFLAGLLGAVCLGLGWVLQQRVAAHAALSELLSFRLVLHLMSKPVWWIGIGAMIAGSALGGWALQLGSVTLVEPLLSTNLLFAFVIAAWLKRVRVTVRELLGAALLSAALGVFIGVGRPRSAAHIRIPGLPVSLLALGVVAGVVVVLVGVARTRPLHVESVLIATGAGLMYGLQDVATRATFVLVDRHGFAHLLGAIWPYLLVGSAAVGIMLSQSAFRAARLDYSLPPTAAAEPVTGIGLGVTVLGDRIALGAGPIAAEALCLLAMVCGVVLIARSGSLAHGWHVPHPHVRRRA